MVSLIWWRKLWINIKTQKQHNGYYIISNYVPTTAFNYITWTIIRQYIRTAWLLASKTWHNVSRSYMPTMIFSSILLWQLNYPSTNQCASHIWTYWVKAEETGKAISQHPLVSDPAMPSSHHANANLPSEPPSRSPFHLLWTEGREAGHVFRTRLLILPDCTGL